MSEKNGESWASSISPFPSPLRKQMASGMVMFAVVNGIVETVALPSAIHVGLVVAIGAGVYFTTLYATSMGFRSMVWEVSPV